MLNHTLIQLQVKILMIMLNISTIIKSKLMLALFVGVALGPLTAFIEKYIYDDWQFLQFLGLLICLDTALGVCLHWRSFNISSEGFGRVINKGAVYASFLIVVHILGHFTIDGQQNTLFGWLDIVAYNAIVVKEALSICENLARLRPGLIPSWFVKRLKDFDQNGKFSNEAPDELKA